MDPDGTGEQQKWFEGQVPFESQIQVPGSWDGQGFGAETDKVWHNFIGVGWYLRSVEIPADWTGRKVFLCIQGVHRISKTWVNGVYLGDHVGYLSPFEYDVTQWAKPGQPITIAIAVDSQQQWDRDGLQGCIDILDEMQIPWGGLWGHVSLEARADVWLDELCVRTDIDSGAATVSARTDGNRAGFDSAKVEILDADGNRVAQQQWKLDPANGGFVEGKATVSSPRLWSPNHPYLYTARLSLLLGNTEIDSISTRFGMRELEIRGPFFYLNGNRFYLHGYGDDSIYPETMSPPTDKDVYLQRLRLIKQYGFNGVRHHSHFLPPEYYDACDEAGILVQPELPIAYQPFYDKATGDAVKLYKTEWIAAIKRFRNHPSIFAWCMGNELSGKVPHNQELYDIAKQLDPSRPVIDTDGLFGSDWMDGKLDRPTLDYYMLQFDVWNLPLDRPDKYKLGAVPAKPALSHETGNFGTFPLFDQIDLFKHNFKPFWLTAAKERVADTGLLAENELWAANSQRLYWLCHKLDIENLRKNPYLSGHHWWLFQDYWTGSNGLVDAYFRPKAAIRPEQVRAFVNDVVLLEEGLNITYAAGDPIKWKFIVSNYGESPIENASLHWDASADGKSIAQGEESSVNVPQGEVQESGQGEFVLGEVASPTRVLISARMSAPSQEYRNEWTTWVYPLPPTPRLARPLYASRSMMRLLEPFGAQPLPEDGSIPKDAVCVGRVLTPAMIESLSNGARLILLRPEEGFISVNNRFKTSWWMGNAADNNVGTVVYDNPVTSGIAPEGWCDQGWYALLEGAQSYVLNEFPSQPRVLIRAIDVLSVCRNKALLFDAKVGEGVLTVCGLNLLPPNDRRPEQRWLLTRLLENACSSVLPEAELPVDFLKGMAVEPIPGLCVEGFGRLLDEASTETGIWRSYREDDAKYFICRQTAEGNRLEWESALIPSDTGQQPVNLVFAGALGWRTEPETDGFQLSINGSHAIRFDVTESRTSWESADKRIILEFIPKRQLPPDSMGIFCLKVAPGVLPPGRPCTLSVQSLGKDSQRWFAINPYANVVENLNP